MDLLPEISDQEGIIKFHPGLRDAVGLSDLLLPVRAGICLLHASTCPKNCQKPCRSDSLGGTRLLRYGVGTRVQVVPDISCMQFLVMRECFTGKVCFTVIICTYIDFLCSLHLTWVSVLHWLLCSRVSVKDLYMSYLDSLGSAHCYRSGVAELNFVYLCFVERFSSFRTLYIWAARHLYIQLSFVSIKL